MTLKRLAEQKAGSSSSFPSSAACSSSERGGRPRACQAFSAKQYTPIPTTNSCPTSQSAPAHKRGEEQEEKEEEQVRCCAWNMQGRSFKVVSAALGRSGNEVLGSDGLEREV